MKAIERSQPAGFPAPEVARSFEEIREETKKSSPDGGERVVGVYGWEKKQNKASGEDEVYDFVTESLSGRLEAFAKTRTGVPVGNQIFEVVSQ